MTTHNVKTIASGEYSCSCGAVWDRDEGGECPRDGEVRGHCDCRQGRDACTCKPAADRLKEEWVRLLSVDDQLTNAWRLLAQHAEVVRVESQLRADAERLLAQRDARIAELEARWWREVYGLNNEGDPIGGDPAGGYIGQIDILRKRIATLESQQAASVGGACCTPSAEENELLRNGDYTSEELWGGPRPTCPKCIRAALSPAGGGVVEGPWFDGEPPHPWNKEWFIAETIHGDRVVLCALHEEHTYDYSTANGTYLLAKNVKRWCQFPDSAYVQQRRP